MNTSFHHVSAKIYQFPIGGRAGMRRDDVEPATDIKPRISEAACGSGWYHEAAIEDAKRTGEH
jgi:hypothetical protein